MNNEVCRDEVLMGGRVEGWKGGRVEGWKAIEQCMMGLRKRSRVEWESKGRYKGR